MELLAPVGSFEAFFAALENGADAFYAGLKQFNARTQAPNFTIEEIARLNEYVHKKGKKLYVVLNSLILEREIPQILNTLAALDAMRPDALIIQDLGVARLALKIFPKLRLHASTLMAVHNSAGVAALSDLGFKRVNLARECTFQEVSDIVTRSNIEIETFVHGALCFSYSGLCLMSSFLGGKSSLRGRCTQPCRRLYQWGNEHGFLFSCNDMSAVKWVTKLRHAGISAIKIEGRMKGASYVGSVVAAYRSILDAPPDMEEQAIEKALELLKKTISRRYANGYLPGVPAEGILEPHLTGAGGKFLGKVVPLAQDSSVVTIKLKDDLSLGDRVRLVTDQQTKHEAFFVKEMRLRGRPQRQVSKGDVISLKLPVQAKKGDLLFKVEEDINERRRMQKNLRDKIIRATTLPEEVFKVLKSRQNKRLLASLPTVPRESMDRPRHGLFIKVKDFEDLKELSRARCAGVVITLNQQNLKEAYSTRELIKRFKDRLYWSLPTIIQEDDLTSLRSVIASVQELGCAGYCVSNIAHFSLLKGMKGRILSEYPFNVLNRQAMLMLAEMGCQAIAVSVETTRDNLYAMLSKPTAAAPWMVVYSHLPLFISRLIIKKDAYKRKIRSPKGELFKAERVSNLTLVKERRPFSLAGFTKELDQLGVTGKLVDFTGGTGGMSKKNILKAFESSRIIPDTTIFNFFGNLE